MSSHLTEKIAEYVLGELSASEVEAADRHLAHCAGCREQIEQFQQTHAMLKMSPDVEPPRRIVFEVEKPAFLPWVWRWLAPMAASAVVAFAIVSMTPRPQPQIVERVVVQQQAPAPMAAQPVDYERIVNEVRDEIRKLDAAQSKEIQRVRGELAFVESQQWVARRNDAEMQASIQQIALKSEDRE